MAELSLKRLGLCHFRDALALQDECLLNLSLGVESLISARHYSIVTYTAKKRLPDGVEIESYKVDRGGGLIAYSPEQLTFYPILDLNLHKKDINWYINALEEVIIRALGELSIQANRGEVGICSEYGAIIALLGLKIRNWQTSFGFTINVEPSPLYKEILSGYRITSVKEVLPETQDLSYLMLEGLVTKHFISLFGYSSCM